MRNELRLFLLILICFPATLFASADKLVFAIDLIRHGDKTPSFVIPTVNHEWKEGLGQLTAEGMRQEYELGTKFRNRYIHQTHLLPDHYQSGTMYVRSTDYERTIMSAESLLMGLYPCGSGPVINNAMEPALPFLFQPIPVFSAPAKYDTVIYKEMDDDVHEKLLQKYVYSTNEWHKKDEEFKSRYSFWSHLLGIKINDLRDIEDVADTLLVYQSHHLPLPAGLSIKDSHLIISLGNWIGQVEENPSEIAAIHSGQLMTNIGNFLKQGSQNSSKLKYVLLSAHDDTIASALVYMGIILNNFPPYASDLNFSLYESGPHYYTVKITYNDQILHIPGCGGSTCELNRFLELTKKPNTNKISLTDTTV